MSNSDLLLSIDNSKYRQLEYHDVDGLTYEMIEEFKELPILKTTGCLIEYYNEDYRNALSFGINELGRLAIRINKGYIVGIFDDYPAEFRPIMFKTGFYHECGHLYSYYYNDFRLLENDDYFLSLNNVEKSVVLLKEEIFAWNIGYDLYVKYDNTNSSIFYTEKEDKISWLKNNKDLYLYMTLKYNGY